MIVRRRHNSRFAALPNAIWEDDRLSVEAKGVLGYLLSRPHNWHVRLAQVADKLALGRQKVQRIMRELIDAGYAIREQRRIDGVFGPIEYVIRDEPAEVVADDEAELLASPASNSVASLPQTDFQPAVSPRVEKPRAENPRAENQPADNNKERIYNKTNHTKDAGARDDGSQAKLDKLVALWPPDLVLSQRSAEQAWQSIPPDGRHSLVANASRYLDDCRTSNRKICNLTTYIRERRDERFANACANKLPSIMVSPHSPQWLRWRDHRRASGKSVAFMDTQAARGVGWSVPSEWPPDSAQQRTGP